MNGERLGGGVVFGDGCDVERSGAVGRRRLLCLYLRWGIA